VPDRERARATGQEHPEPPNATEAARGELAGEAQADEGYPDPEGYEDLEGLEEEDEPRESVDELGRRHIRRAAPEGTQRIIENEAPRETGLPDSIERWRKRTATGTVLTAFALGLQQVFEPEREQPPIIMETSGEPPQDLPVEAQLEQLGPRQSSVTVRPWLLEANPTAPAAAQARENSPEGEAAEASEHRPGEGGKSAKGEAEDVSDYWPDEKAARAKGEAAEASDYWPDKEGESAKPDDG
jgi:hypothetical protein